jgi:hypothetical protein
VPRVVVLVLSDVEAPKPEQYVQSSVRRIEKEMLCDGRFANCVERDSIGRTAKRGTKQVAGWMQSL